MKEFDELKKALEEKKVIAALQSAVNVIPAPNGLTDAEKDKLREKAIKHALIKEFDRNKELKELFCNYCFEVGMNALVTRLHIKPDPNHTPTEKEMLLLALTNYFIN